MLHGIFKPTPSVTAEAAATFIAATLLSSARDIERVTDIFGKNDALPENEQAYFGRAKSLIETYANEVSNDLENNFEDTPKTAHKL